MIWLLGGYMWLYVHRPFEVWPALGDMQIERIYMIAMLVVWLFSPKCWNANPIHYFTALFSATLFVSWLSSPYMDKKICAGTVEDFFKVIVFYLLFLTSVRDERSLWWMIVMFVGSVGLYMAHSFLEFLNGRYEYRMGIVRMNGIDSSFGDPNAFASTLLYTVPLALTLWMAKPPKILKILLVLHLAGACMCISLTGSRTGFIGLCLCGTLTLLVSVRRKLLVVVLGGIGGAAAFAVATVALPESLQNRYLTIVDSSYGPKNANQSANSRLDGLLDGIHAWQNNLLIGNGPRSFDYATGRMMGSHNLYGQTLCEMGLLGALYLIGYTVCFALSCRTIRSYYRTHPDKPRDFLFYLSRNLGILLVLLLVLGWSGHTLYRYNWRWFAAFLVVAVCCIRRREREDALGGPRRKLPYFVRRTETAKQLVLEQ